MMSGWKQLINGGGQNVQIYSKVIFVYTHEKYYLTQSQAPSHKNQSRTILTFHCVVYLSLV